MTPSDLSVDGVITVWPEGYVDAPDAPTLLIHYRDDQDFRPRPGRDDWTVDDIVAYSKLCTHVGCPVGLYQANSGLLLCPCHQSTFAVLDGAGRSSARRRARSRSYRSPSTTRARSSRLRTSPARSAPASGTETDDFEDESEVHRAITLDRAPRRSDACSIGSNRVGSHHPCVVRRKGHAARTRTRSTSRNRCCRSPAVPFSRMYSRSTRIMA